MKLGVLSLGILRYHQPAIEPTSKRRACYARFNIRHRGQRVGCNGRYFLRVCGRPGPAAIHQSAGDGRTGHGWTGFYVGGNGGYSWGRSNTDVSYFNTVTGAPIVPPAGSITSSRFDMNGGVAGGQAGYNWQRTATGFWALKPTSSGRTERGRAAYNCAGDASPEASVFPD